MLTCSVCAPGFAAPTAAELDSMRFFTSWTGYPPQDLPSYADALAYLRRTRPSGSVGSQSRLDWDFLVTQATPGTLSAGGVDLKNRIYWISSVDKERLAKALGRADAKLVVYTDLAQSLGKGSDLGRRIADFGVLESLHGKVWGWIGTVADVQRIYDAAIAKLEEALKPKPGAAPPPPATRVGMSTGAKVAIAGGTLAAVGLAVAIGLSARRGA